MADSITKSVYDIFDKRPDNDFKIKYKDATNSNPIDAQNTATKALSIDWKQTKTTHVPVNICIDGQASAAGTLTTQFLLDNISVFRLIKEDVVAGYHHTNADFLIQNVKSGSHTLDVVCSITAGHYTIASGYANMYIQTTGLIGALREARPEIKIQQQWSDVLISVPSFVINTVSLSDSLSVEAKAPIPLIPAETFTGFSIDFILPTIGIVSLTDSVNIVKT